MVVIARSRPLSIRVMIRVSAQQNADTSGTPRPDETRWNPPQDDQHADQSDRGRGQRRRPTLSRRNKIDSAVTEQRRDELVAEASAIGRNRKPEMNNSDDPSNAAPRMACRPRRLVCKANSGEPGTIAGTITTANTRNLIQAISIDGNVADRLFRRHVRGAEKHRRGKDQRDAAERTIGARGARQAGPISSQATARQHGPAWRLRQVAGSTA